MKKTTTILISILAVAVGVVAGNYLQPLNFVDGSVRVTFAEKKSVVRESHEYSILTKSKSFFKKDEHGALIPVYREGKKFFEPGEGEYTFKRKILSDQSALIVMDPWADSGDEFLNNHYSPIYKNGILPLVKKAVELKMTVIILTNDPEKNYADYGSAVFPELQDMERTGKVQIFYHQDYDDDSFGSFLKSKSINTLIYSGFASNMCVIGRSLGMIPMQIQGFRLFFVPKASAAVEYKDSWEVGLVHEATTSMISQWVGEIIDLDDFINIEEPISNI